MLNATALGQKPPQQRNCPSRVSALLLLKTPERWHANRLTERKGAVGGNSEGVMVVWVRTAVVGQVDLLMSWPWKIRGKVPRMIVGNEVIYGDWTEQVRAGG